MKNRMNLNLFSTLGFKTTTRIGLLTVLFAAFSLAPAFALESGWAGLPNPASGLCLKLNGTPVAYTLAGSGGSSSGLLCDFNGALVGETSLWYALNTGHELALDKFLEHPSATPQPNVNPASSYCGLVGGTFLLANLANGDAAGLCMFSEGGHLSIIEEWTLFRGPQSAQNARLLEVLTHERSHSEE